MHAEYRVPGGGLLVFDAEVLDGRIAHPRLGGEFSAEPAEALEDVVEALAGLPLEATSERIARSVREAMPRRAELIGATPEQIGVVVRRAITGAADWRDFEWEVLRTPMFDPRIHVALDQVLAEEVGAGRRGPSMRFWRGWWKSAVLLGSFQSLREEVDEERAAQRDFDVVRRVTGGGTMFMERGSVIAYSIYAPQELVGGMDLAQSYAFLNAWAMEGLAELGVRVRTEALGEIVCDEGRIGEAAQKRFGSGAVLHHAVLGYEIDQGLMKDVLRGAADRRGRTNRSRGRASSIKEQSGLRRDDVVDHLEQTFLRLHGGRLGELDVPEQRRAIELAESKFSSREWTARIP